MCHGSLKCVVFSDKSTVNSILDGGWVEARGDRKTSHDQIKSFGHFNVSMSLCGATKKTSHSRPLELEDMKVEKQGPKKKNCQILHKCLCKCTANNGADFLCIIWNSFKI